MTKMEYQNEIDNVNIELRSLMDSVKDTSKEINLEEVRAKKAELEEKRTNLIKSMAECERPTEKVEEKSEWRKIADAMVEHRTVNLSGTGIVNTVKELAKKIVENTDILSGVRFFYGKDAATKIPVWGTKLTADFVAEGATATPKENALSVTSMDAQQVLSSLPVSNMALDLGAANLAAELPALFAGSLSDLLADGMINGKSFSVSSDTTVCMVGLFAASNNTTAYSAACTLTKLAELARTVKAKNYKNPVIIMSPTVYQKFLSDSTSGEDIKIYKECLIREKMIEDVKIVLTAYAPASGSGSQGAWQDNDVIAVAGDLSNYAIGMAGQLKVEQKGTAGSTVTTFDATAYAAGKPVIAADFYQYKIDVA